MCVTWYHIVYCGTCKSYIDSSKAGTVFCGLFDAGRPCAAEKAISESPEPGHCAMCRPRPQIRRSRRLLLRLRSGGAMANHDEMASNASANGEDKDDNMDEDTSDGGSDENGDDGTDDPDDGDYTDGVPQKDDEEGKK